MSEEYLSQLRAEKDNIDPSFAHAGRLISEEIDRVERGTKYTEVHNDKKVKLTEKVVIPVKEHPKFNFVGKLLGPQGNSLKRLQAETGTKMSILGRGSMRDKKKEDDLRKEGDPKYAHLGDDLHVFVEVFASPPDAHSRMSHALAELTKFMIPDNLMISQDFNDEIRQQQLQELMYLNGDEGQMVPPPAPPGPVRGRGRGRGVPEQAGRGVPRGGPGPALLATPPGRGRPAPRGVPPSRGGPPVRGAPRGAPGARGGMTRPAPPIPAYEEDYSYGNTHNGGGYDDQGYGYGEQTYRDSYEQGYGNGTGDTQYFEYAAGGAGREAGYEEYGESWGQNQTSYGKVEPVGRGKGEFRSHPYGRGAALGRGVAAGRGARY